MIVGCFNPLASSLTKTSNQNSNPGSESDRDTIRLEKMKRGNTWQHSIHKQISQETRKLHVCDCLCMSELLRYIGLPTIFFLELLQCCCVLGLRTQHQKAQFVYPKHMFLLLHRLEPSFLHQMRVRFLWGYFHPIFRGEFEAGKSGS